MGVTVTHIRGGGSILTIEECPPYTQAFLQLYPYNGCTLLILTHTDTALSPLCAMQPCPPHLYVAHIHDWHGSLVISTHCPAVHTLCTRDINVICRDAERSPIPPLYSVWWWMLYYSQNRCCSYGIFALTHLGNSWLVVVPIVVIFPIGWRPRVDVTITGLTHLSDWMLHAFRWRVPCLSIYIETGCWCT